MAAGQYVDWATATRPSSRRARRRVDVQVRGCQQRIRSLTRAFASLPKDAPSDSDARCFTRIAAMRECNQRVERASSVSSTTERRARASTQRGQDMTLPGLPTASLRWSSEAEDHLPRRRQHGAASGYGGGGTLVGRRSAVALASTAAWSTTCKKLKRSRR